MKSIPIIKPQVSEEELKNVRDALNSGWLTRGNLVEEFEKMVARYVNSKYALAVNSATSGLFLCLKALNIQREDEVIVPAFTFPATANVVEHLGAKPVFVDIELERMGVDPDKLEKAITHQTKAIILVHLFGMPAKIDEVMNVANSHNLYVIEDAAPALGVKYKGKHAGTFGICGVYSFHPRKIITTGEGGVVVTNDKIIYEKIKILHSHGENLPDIVRSSKIEISYPDFVEAGYNFRMTNFQGALGISQMKKIETIIDERRKIAKIYMDYLSSLTEKFIFSKEEPFERFTYQSFVIYYKNNVSTPIINFLRRNGVESMKGTYNVPKLSYYSKKYGYSSDKFPNTEFAETTSITLPLYNGMEVNTIQIIMNYLSRFVKGI